MLWGDIILLRDQCEAEYLELNERQTKTRQGDDIRNTRHVNPRMYAVPGSGRCPVSMYKLYSEKRPSQMNKSDSPFYLAINVVESGSSRPWFKNSPMGVNKLNSLMRIMALKGELHNTNLTNHSARKRLMQKLVSSDVQPTEIMQITGHQNVQSINNYSSLDESKLKNISSILSNTSTAASEISSEIAECHISSDSSSSLRYNNAPPSMFQNAVFYGQVHITFQGTDGGSSASEVVNVDSSKYCSKRVVIDSDSDYSQ